MKLVYFDDINFLGDNINTMKEITETFLEASSDALSMLFLALNLKTRSIKRTKQRSNYINLYPQ
jgi:hypothetical protein